MCSNNAFILDLIWVLALASKQTQTNERGWYPLMQAQCISTALAKKEKPNQNQQLKIM